MQMVSRFKSFFAKTNNIVIKITYYWLNILIVQSTTEMNDFWQIECMTFLTVC